MMCGATIFSHCVEFSIYFDQTRIDCGKTKQDTLLSNSLQYKKSITRQEGPVLAR